MSAPARVAVLGGGIAGLAAAWELRRNAGTGGPAVSLLEAAPELGGKIRTGTLAGEPFDLGPEAILARVPDAVELCGALGLGEELVAPATTSAWLWSGGRLRPLPTGILGGGASVGEVLRARILSPAGVARAALDLVLPARRPEGDESIGALVRRRLGGQVAERLFDPLLGGIYAGSVDRLSVRAAAPWLQAIAGRRRSLVRGLTAAPAAAPVPGPTFLTLRGGLGRLVGRLAERLDGVEIRTGAPVRRLEPAPGGGWHVEAGDGEPLLVDAVIAALPAFAAADVLATAAPGAARELAAIAYASVGVVGLAYPETALRAPLRGSGFLVPRSEGRLITACTWSSAKWPHLAAPGRVLLRCSVGRAGDGDWAALSDQALAGRAAAELREATGLRGEPLAAQVARWERALPQYEPGHLDRVARAEAALADLPPLALAGAAYRGVGVPACIAQGRAAARRVLAAGGGAEG